MLEPASKSMPAIDYVSMVRAVYGDRRATLVATLASAVGAGAAAFKTGHWTLWAITAIFVLIAATYTPFLQRGIEDPFLAGMLVFIWVMAVATREISCCWLWIPCADCSETALTSSMAAPS